MAAVSLVLDEDEIPDVTSPFGTVLLTHQRIADAVKSYVRTEFKGDVALVTVKADTGRRLVESTVKMVHEHGRWKLADFTTDFEAQTE